ncbi:MAG: FliM/FliN family flagellar motor switch protein, partial [Myxococcales bacterium]|nr:FliM/FliN family flagellar motor switch protein [Myxococcales bacterium]
FFARRGVRIRHDLPRLVRASELTSMCTAPCYLAPLAAEPGGTRAALIVDGPAIAFLLEGSLGGDGSAVPELSPKGLSVAQHAFIARLSKGLVGVVSSALNDAIGLRLSPLPRTGDERGAGAFIALPMEILDPSADDPDQPVGTVTLALSKLALLAAGARREKPRHHPDERVVRALERTELDVVVELGRIRLPLMQVARLMPGDTLRLAVPVEDGKVDVRIDDKTLFRARPTTSGSQLAVRLLDDARPEPSPSFAPSTAPRSERPSLKPPTPSGRPPTSLRPTP